MCISVMWAAAALCLWKCDFFKHFMFEASAWRCFMHSDCSYKTHETPRSSETERYHQWKHFLCLNQMRCCNWKCSNLLLEFPTLLFFLIFRTKLHKYNILHILYLRNQVNSIHVSSFCLGCWTYHILYIPFLLKRFVFVYSQVWHLMNRWNMKQLVSLVCHKDG